MESLGLLNWVYFALLIIGFILALLTLVGQGIGDFGAVDVDFDAGDVPSFDQGEVGLGSISPMSIASFVTAFGAFGLISSQLFGASAVTSLIFAVGGGLVVGSDRHDDREQHEETAGQHDPVDRRTKLVVLV